MAYRILSHTADTGVEATEPMLAELIATLATAMFALMGYPPSHEAWDASIIEVDVASGSAEELVVDSLSELLYLSDARGLNLGTFGVDVGLDGVSATIHCIAARWDDGGVTGPPIKAVTYHGLAVEERDGGWYGRVYFDV